MRDSTCKNCLWGDQCPQDEICNDYYPLDDMCDEWIDEYIENRKIENRIEWFDMMDCGDDEFMEGD